ncbi:hypothetical protein SUGI_1147140 [Cryptomeria japonica]|nr:hypothetical protein SUGI_1147140 [Cryptomeria japonica]
MTQKIEKRSKSGERRNTFVSTPMLRFKRERKVGNLDLNLFCATQNTDQTSHGVPQNTDQASNGEPQNPFLGFHSPVWENISPVFRSPPTQNNQQQQQYSQLTIFYAGAVNVYEVSPDLAEAVMVMANRESSSKSSFTIPIPTTTCPSKMASVDQIDQNQSSITPKPANFPFARQNSLQRFVEKRKAKTAVHAHLHHN